VLLVLAAAIAACGGSGPSTATSHTSSPARTSPVVSVSASGPAPTPSARPVSQPYGVLVGSQAAATYAVSLVATDGTVAASGEASSPPVVTCANAAGAPVPLPVSTSNSRAYFMDAGGVVRFLAPGGESGRATTVPAPTSSRRASFAVSPDDQRIAVVVADYNATGASTRLYVEDLNGGGNHLDIFSESGARTLWPIGWHGIQNLVVGVVPSCTQGGGPFCCGIQELHVVDPATATRRFTLGGITTCPVVGPPSAAGVICWDGSTSKVLSWTGATIRTYPMPGPALQYLSPNGTVVAVVDNTGTNFLGGGTSISGLYGCTWINDQLVLAGGDSQHQPRIGDLVTPARVVPVAAQGDCGGRLPGGL